MYKRIEKNNQTTYRHKKHLVNQRKIIKKNHKKKIKLPPHQCTHHPGTQNTNTNKGNKHRKLNNKK